MAELNEIEAVTMAANLNGETVRNQQQELQKLCGLLFRARYQSALTDCKCESCTSLRLAIDNGVASHG